MNLINSYERQGLSPVTYNPKQQRIHLLGLIAQWKKCMGKTQGTLLIANNLVSMRSYRPFLLKQVHKESTEQRKVSFLLFCLSPNQQSSLPTPGFVFKDHL